MLFSYTYVPHQMEKMKEFIDFIFYEIWCKAPIGLVFHPDLFQNNPDLTEIMSKFGFDAKAAERGKVFYEDVKTIYMLFAPLSAQEINTLKEWYIANNDIKKICANDPSAQIARYIDIQVKHPKLSKYLASFFRGLYDNTLLSLSALKSKIGSLREHSLDFFTVNNIGKCPFCGINDLKGIHHTRREAYDHYLPKYRYPFNSINFFNLAPACNECNSVYKLSRDPAHHPKGSLLPGQRRKFFYPFTDTYYSIDLKIDLDSPDIDILKPTDVKLSFGPLQILEEIETWKEVYGIEERYRAKLLDGDGKAWLTEVLDEWRWQDESAGEEGRLPFEYLRDLNRHAAKSPYNGANFLKKPFLEACEKKGVFNVLNK